MDVCEVAPDVFEVAQPDTFEIVPFTAPTRAQIMRLEAEIAQVEQVPLSEKHYFASGIYAREITIPAGTVLTGKVHKTEHINIVSQGTITVWTEQGMKKVSAPFTMVSQPGTKRVGYAHTDTVWTTIHHSFERDLDQLEAQLIEPARQLDNDTEEALWLGQQ